SLLWDGMEITGEFFARTKQSKSPLCSNARGAVISGGALCESQREHAAAASLRLQSYGAVGHPSSRSGASERPECVAFNSLGQPHPRYTRYATGCASWDVCDHQSGSYADSSGFKCGLREVLRAICILQVPAFGGARKQCAPGVGASRCGKFCTNQSAVFH